MHRHKLKRENEKRGQKRIRRCGVSVSASLAPKAPRGGWKRESERPPEISGRRKSRSIREGELVQNKDKIAIRPCTWMKLKESKKEEEKIGKARKRERDKKNVKNGRKERGKVEDVKTEGLCGGVFGHLEHEVGRSIGR